VGDSYEIGYAASRFSSYSGTGTPLTWFDGVLSCSGAITNDNEMFAWYQDTYAARAVVPSDIDIAITAAESVPGTYDVGVTITVEASGTTRDLICHVYQVHDHYPASSDNRYRNCVRKHRQQIMTLGPGENYFFTRSIVLDAVDVADIENVKFIAFVQIQGDIGAREIYNTRMLEYPFAQPPVVGDVDGDRDVDLSDLAALLGVYGLCTGDAGYNDAADFIDDGCIDLSDLAALLGNYGYVG
jgi:hypothetical protein